MGSCADGKNTTHTEMPSTASVTKYIQSSIQPQLRNSYAEHTLVAFQHLDYSPTLEVPNISLSILASAGNILPAGGEA